MRPEAYHTRNQNSCVFWTKNKLSHGFILFDMAFGVRARL